MAKKWLSSRWGRRAVGNYAAIVFVALGFVFASDAKAVADTLTVECDALLQVDPSSNNTTAQLFKHYSLDIDWDNKIGSLHLAPGPTADVVETYTLNSRKDQGYIDLRPGKQIETVPGSSAYVPLRFYIVRNTGWFIKDVGHAVDQPKPDVTEAGVCGGPPKF